MKVEDWDKPEFIESRGRDMTIVARGMGATMEINCCQNDIEPFLMVAGTLDAVACFANLHVEDTALHEELHAALLRYFEKSLKRAHLGVAVWRGREETRQ